jgi:hypothetical protein
MYSRVGAFAFSNPAELRDRGRIRRLCWSRWHAPLLVPLGFAIAALCALGSGLWMAIVVLPEIPVAGVFGALAGLACGLPCLWAAKLFWQERSLDPLRGYLKKPEDYEFVDAEITTARYQASGRQRRICVQGRARTVEGKKLVFIEFFSPQAWPFGDSDETARRAYPLPAAVIYARADPAGCALVGWPESLARSWPRAT